MTDTYLVGQLGTPDVNALTQPEDWSPIVHQIIPAGQAPFAAIMNAIGGDPTSSKNFHWWEEEFPDQTGAVTGTFTNVTLQSAYTTGGVVGTPLYFKMSQADAEQFIVGMEIVAINETSGVEVAADVTQVVRAGATSYVLGVLLEADTNDDLAGTTSIWCIGNAQAEGADLPESQIREPNETSNHTQIFARKIQISGTKLAEMERIQPRVLQRARTNAMLMLMIEQEKNLIWGKYAKKMVNGKEKRFMRGLHQAIKENTNNIFDFKNSTDSDFVGKSHDQAGLRFLHKQFEVMSRKAPSDQWLVFAGSLAIEGINQALQLAGHQLLQPRQTEMGIKVRTLVTPHGDFNLVKDPLFTTHPSRLRAMLAVQLPLLQKRTLRPLRFLPDAAPETVAGPDERKEGWRGEWGLQYHNLNAMGYFENVGLDNIK